MAGSSKLVEVTDGLIALLESVKGTYGLHDVWYGEETLIPRTPAISVSPDRKGRQIAETSSMTMNTFDLSVVIFHSRLEDPQVTRRDCDILAEQIEDELHADRRLGGLLIHSYVQTVEPGFVTRGKVVMKATRLAWQGISKTRL